MTSLAVCNSTDYRSRMRMPLRDLPSRIHCYLFTLCILFLFPITILSLLPLGFSFLCCHMRCTMAVCQIARLPLLEAYVDTVIRQASNFPSRYGLWRILIFVIPCHSYQVVFFPLLSIWSLLHPHH